MVIQVAEATQHAHRRGRLLHSTNHIYQLSHTHACTHMHIYMHAHICAHMRTQHTYMATYYIQISLHNTVDVLASPHILAQNKIRKISTIVLNIDGLWGVLKVKRCSYRLTKYRTSDIKL